jgi:hypothetical protein
MIQNNTLALMAVAIMAPTNKNAARPANNWLVPQQASAKVVLTAGYKMVKEETVSSDAGAAQVVRHYVWPRDLQTGQSG